MADLISMLAAAAGAAAGGGEVDPNFNQTVLLLHGDGTDGAQNNTFLDSGTANSGSGFTITRNGNTTQGTFSPFSLPDGRWSVYHDGSSDYVTAGTTSSFNFVHNTSGLATIEAWIYLNALTGVIQVIASNIESSSSVGFVFAVGTDNKPYLAIYRGVGGSTALDLKATNVISANRWYHIAAVIDYSGNNGKLYIDGVQEDSEAFGNTPSGSNASYALHIGRNAATTFGSLDFAGYISNFRIVNSASVYTAAFSVPTSPLTAITDTKLLIHQSNRFVDNSASPFTLTVSGLKVTPFSPFAPTAAYSASVNGGSGYFDQSGDYLTFGTTTLGGTTVSTFTIEGWIYPLSFSDEMILIGDAQPTGGLKYFSAETTTAGKISLSWFDGASKSCTSDTALQLNAWNYFAIRVSSNAISIYVNSASASSVTGTTTLTNRNGSVNAAIGQYSNSNNLNGYLSDLHVSTVARTIAVPTAPPVSDANTRFLLNFTNAGIFDNTGKNVLETVGNAQIDTTTKKYGTGAIEYDGSGDFLKILPKPDLILSGDFTIDCWFNFTGTSGAYESILDTRDSSASTTGFFLGLDTALKPVFFTAGANRILAGSAISTSTWYFLRLTRASGDIKLFIDGTQVGSTYSNSNVFTNPKFNLGADQTGTSDFWTGFVDDFRITNGVARSGAEVPTKAFPNL